MHFQCSLTDLLPVVSLVEKAVAAQDNIPVLKGIHIMAGDNQVTLTATNLELGIRSELPAHVSKADQAVVDGKLLAALVRTLPQEPIIFELTDQQLMITAGSVEFTLTTLPPEDFPQLPEIEDLVFTLPAKQLLTLIRNTIFACGKDDRRPFVNGVLFEISEQMLHFAATDINRLAYDAILIEQQLPDTQLLIPMKTLQELQRSLPNDDSEIKIAFNTKHVIFEYGNTKITTRLIDDRFPKYKNLFPQEEPIRISISRQILIAAVERAALIDSDDGSQIVIFDAANGVLEIRTPSSSKGKSKEIINVEHEGENGEAAFSARYILDMLKAVDAEQILFHFNSDLRQALMKGDHDQNQKYILMPIRLN